MRRLPARDIMSHPVVTVRPETTIPELVRVLRDHRISGAPVTDRLGRIVGIITENDILMKEADAAGLGMLAYAVGSFGDGSEAEATLDRVRGRTVGDVMMTEVITARQDTTVRELAAVMARHGINRVPIVRNEHVIGIVSRADVLRLYDRPAGGLRAEVRRCLVQDLGINADQISITIVDGVVALHGTVGDPRDIHLVQTFLRDIDGVVAIDVTNLRPASISIGS
jgi:CBS domain-containing protein